jgi:hypothetical protein
MPDWARRNIDMFRRLNPDHDIIVHDESALMDCYTQAYQEIEEPCSRSDLVRYSILERHGGWYFDTDYLPCRPVADAQRAWNLDGRKLFCTEAWADKSNPGWIANGTLACGLGCQAWHAVRKEVLSAPDRSRMAFGPVALRRAVERHPELFVVGGVEWFHGIKHPWSTMLYDQVAKTGSTECIRTVAAKHTGGQLPYAMHLWGWKHGSKIGQAAGRTALVLSHTAPAPGGVWDAVRDGLSGCGYEVVVMQCPQSTPTAIERVGFIPDVAVCWNGRRPEACLPSFQQIEALGVPLLRLELGFFERSKHWQCDHAGFSHTASWCRPDALSQAVSENQVLRMRKFVPRIAPQAPRSSGYVLVLGQVGGDSQLMDSQIRTRLAIQDAVNSALPSDVPRYFRPHPQDTKYANHRMPLMHLPQGADEQYAAGKRGVGLTEALSGARFVVTINSNALTEAMIAGVPCLAFGPSTAIEAGVVRQATAATIKTDMAAMLAGWHPSDEAVERYLTHLACNQYSREELADARVMSSILARAGVALG